MEAWTPDFWEENSGYCLQELKNDDSWEKIPLLNSTPAAELQEGQLVRFRGMVQDMFDPVYYLEKYEVQDRLTSQCFIRSGKFKDSLQCAEHETILFSSDKNVNKDRLPVYLISVPAVNEWAEYKVHKTSSVGSSSVSGIKRSADMDVTMTENGDICRPDGSKRLCAEKPVVEPGQNPSVTVTGLNLPIPNSFAKACIANFYDTRDGELRIADVIEVLGFLSYDPETATESELPPPSLVPRMHIVSFRPVLTCNPLVTPQVTLGDVMANAKKLREDLKLVLTQLLLGDTLAADYLICHLLSRVYMRKDGLVLGKFSLNLMKTDVVPNYCARFYDLLKDLLVKSHYFPMTLDNINNTVMIPKKNYVTNRVESGMLQLSNHTHLVVDETLITTGTIYEKGLRNMAAIESINKSQILKYDFEFYPVEFETDIPLLILSASKSLLGECDYCLPLEADMSIAATIDEVLTAARHYLRDPLLSQLRVYLTLAGSADYDLSPAVQKRIQEDFADMRAEDPRINAQDLHSLLVLARLLSLSEGSQCLTEECWQMARQMESQRKRRLSSPN